jgi:hypothetical protein
MELCGARNEKLICELEKGHEPPHAARGFPDHGYIRCDGTLSEVGDVIWFDEPIRVRNVEL